MSQPRNSQPFWWVNNDLYTNEGTVIRFQAFRKSFHFISTSMYKMIENEEGRIADSAKE